MSFVAKVLEHAGQLEKQAVHDQLDVLSQKLSELEVEVHQLAENKLIQFVPSLTSAESLYQRAQEASQEIASIENKISEEIKGQLSVSTGEFQVLNQQLSEARLMMKGLDYLANIMTLLQSAEEHVSRKEYGQSALAIYKLEKLLKQPLIKQQNRVDILRAMKEELLIQKTSQRCSLSEAWKETVQWRVLPEQKGDKKPPTQVSVCVQCAGEGVLEELVQGHFVTGELEVRMKAFAENCQEYLLPLVLENSDVIVEVNSEAFAKTLLVKLPSVDSTSSNVKKKSIDKGKVTNSTTENAYSNILCNLVLVLQQLHSMLLHIEYRPEEYDGLLDSSGKNTSAVSGQESLMSLLGQEISPWLLKQIRFSVLNQAVPNNAKDLVYFKEVVVKTQWLQEKLLEMGFLEADNQVLLDHMENVNVLFSNKKCQTLLSEARSLMMDSLSDSVAVSEDKPMGELPPLVAGGVKKSNRWEMNVEHVISDNTLKMPKCRISQTVQSLMNLAYETLNEATESSPECAVPMYFAVHGMFETFCHVIPTHHGHQLQEFPQLAALHNNNCMFIAHHLMTLGHQFAPALPSTLHVTFVDLVQKIRELGLEYFLAQLSRQRDLLLECLQGAEGFVSVEEPERFAQTEKAIKQVLIQLGHLQKIWKPVLPINIYKKAMGKLINVIVKSMTDCVASLEDIAQSAAHLLIKLIASLEEECGAFLCSPGEVPSAELLRHVQAWPRLTEMKLLLDASLSDIGDRWAEGKGPLALAFTPAETKQMIRALFQNTDRRANVLASIR